MVSLCKFHHCLNCGRVYVDHNFEVLGKHRHSAKVGHFLLNVYVFPLIHNMYEQYIHFFFVIWDIRLTLHKLDVWGKYYFILNMMHFIYHSFSLACFKMFSSKVKIPLFNIQCENRFKT